MLEPSSVSAENLFGFLVAFFVGFFWLYLGPVEVSRPGIEPEPQLCQRGTFNWLSYQGTPDLRIYDVFAYLQSFPPMMDTQNIFRI